MTHRTSGFDVRWGAYLNQRANFGCVPHFKQKSLLMLVGYTMAYIPLWVCFPPLVFFFSRLQKACGCHSSHDIGIPWHPPFSDTFKAYIISFGLYIYIYIHILYIYYILQYIIYYIIFYYIYILLLYIYVLYIYYYMLYYIYIILLYIPLYTMNSTQVDSIKYH